MGGAASRREDGPDSPRGYDDRSPPDSPLVTPRSPLTFGCEPKAERVPCRAQPGLAALSRAPRRDTPQAAGAHGAHAAADGL
jgi:hypothetical protein